MVCVIYTPEPLPPPTRASTFLTGPPLFNERNLRNPRSQNLQPFFNAVFYFVVKILFYPCFQQLVGWESPTKLAINVLDINCSLYFRCNRRLWFFSKYFAISSINSFFIASYDVLELSDSPRYSNESSKFTSRITSLLIFR